MSSAQVEKFVTLISKDPAALQEASKGAKDPDAFVEDVVR